MKHSAAHLGVLEKEVLASLSPQPPVLFPKHGAGRAVPWSRGLEGQCHANTGAAE